ncbi:DMT family transporter [bacterium]|nr:DMT family transporter [bacterium]
MSVSPVRPDPPRDRHHLRAVGYLTLTAALWSFGGVLIKWVDWNPIAIAATRSWIALPLLFLAAGKGHIDHSKTQWAGAVAYACTVLLFVSANKLTTAANAILLQYTAPVYVAILGHFLLRERVDRTDALAVVLVLAGMSLFFLDKLSAANVLGNGVAVLSGVAFAWLVVLMRRQKHGSPLGSVVLGNLITGIVGIPFMLHPPRDVSSWTGLLLLGVFQIGFSYLFYARAIRHVTALEGILVPVIEPILNPIWAFLFIGERPGHWAFIGGVVVIATVILRSVHSIRSRRVDGPAPQGAA